MSGDEKRELTPANENPWYWLATVHGEQEKERSYYDQELAAKNRVAWNRWMAGALTDDQRAELVTKGFDASGLMPLADEELTEFLNRFTARTGREDAVPPDPNERIDFRGVRFERRVNFAGFVFTRYANFTEAEFSGSADFTEAEFSDAADFKEAEFSGYAYFQKAEFSSIANFQKAAFSSTADFVEAEFSGNAYFIGAAFSGIAAVQKAAFSGKAYYNGAAFSGDAYFTLATFSDIAIFQKAAFSGIAIFHKAAFFDDVNFTAAEFKSHTDFSDAEFKASVPDFRDAELREATEWHGATWPLSQKDKADAQRQVYAYERLKADGEHLKKHEDEQLFFTKELHARRALLWFKWHDKEVRPNFPTRTKMAFDWLLHYAYDISSGYGQSIAWPIFWLVVFFALGADFFALAPVHGGAPLAYDVAAGLSVTNLFSLLPYKPKLEELSTCAKIIGDLQSVLGLILLFLLGLALRNRFRMR